METVNCPNCNTENPVSNGVCSACGYDLRAPAPDPPSRPISADGEAPLPPLPETPVEDAPLEKKPYPRAETFARSTSYSSVEDAAGAFAEGFLSAQTGGRQMMLRETARKKAIGAVILAIVLFLALSLRMLYHRNNLIWYLIIAACIFLAVKFLLKSSNAKAFGKKLASMPGADMESVLMSEFDQMVPVSRFRLLCAGILAVVLAAFLVLFWTPHMIFEKADGVVSLRFYTDSIVKETSVDIPDTWNGEPVKQIRGNVFENITWIEKVRLPSQLKIIRAHAFRNCRRLSEVIVPSTLSSIGSSAFRDCSSLKSISLPRGCIVDSKAFKNSPTTINQR